MPAALDPSLPSGQPPRPAPSLAKARLRSVDLLIGALVLGSVSLVGAATVAARLEAGRTGPPDAAIAEAVETLRRSFGYDGIVHELERLRRSGDPAALSALEDSLREARAAIGRLRPALSGTDPGVGRALDQLDAAGRRLETLLRSGTGELSARIVELPVLEPLFVLDEATLALRDALHAADEPRIRQMFALTLAAACLLAATALLLAFWVRRSLLVPLRRLVADLAAGSSADLDRLALRPDEIGTIATALRGGTSPGAIPATVPAAPATLLPGQDDLLRRIHTLLESLAGTRAETLAGPSRNAAPASPASPVPAAAATDIPIFAAQPSTTPGTPAPGRDALATLLDASATALAHTAASQDLLRQAPGVPGRSAVPELTPPAGPDPATRSERPHPPPEPAPAIGQSTSATTTPPRHAPAGRPGQDEPAPSLHHLPRTDPTHPAQEPDTVSLLRVPAADLPAGRMSDHRAPEAAGHPRADLSATPDPRATTRPHPAGENPPPRATGTNQPGNRNPQASFDDLNKHGPSAHGSRPAPGESLSASASPALVKPGTTDAPNEPEPPRAGTHTLTGAASPHQPAMPPGEPEQGGTRRDSPAPTISQPANAIFTNEPEDGRLHRPASPGASARQDLAHRPNDPGHPRARPDILSASPSSSGITTLSNQPDAPGRQPFTNPASPSEPALSTNEPWQGDTRPDSPSLASPSPAGTILPSEPENRAPHPLASSTVPVAHRAPGHINEPGQGRSQSDGLTLPSSGSAITNEPEDDGPHPSASPDDFGPQGPLDRTNEPGQGGSQLDRPLPASSRPAVAIFTNESEDGRLHQPAFSGGFGLQGPLGRTIEPGQGRRQLDRPLPASSRAAGAIFTNELEDGRLHQPAFPDGFGPQGPLDRINEPGQGRSQLDRPLPASSRPAIESSTKEPEDDSLHQTASPDGFGPQASQGGTSEPVQGGSRPDRLSPTSSRPESTICTNEPEDDCLHRPAFPAAFCQRDAMARTSEPKQDKNRSDSRSPTSAGSGSTVRTNEPEDDSLHQPAPPASFSHRDAMDHTSEPGRGGSRPDSGSPASAGPGSTVRTNEPENGGLRQPSSPAAFSQRDAMDHTSEPGRGGSWPDSGSPVSLGPASAAVTNEPEDDGLRQPSSPATFRQRDPTGRTSEAGLDGSRPDIGSPASAGPGNPVRTNEPENGGLRQPAFPATFSQRGPLGRTSEPGQGGSRPPVLPRPASTLCTNEPEDGSLHQPASLDGFGAQGPMDRANGSEEGRNRPDSLTPASPGTPRQHGPMARTGEAAQDRTRPEGLPPAPSGPASAIRTNESGNDRPRGQASAGAIGLYTPAARTTEPGSGSSRPEKLSLTPPGAAGADRADQPDHLHRPAAPGVTDALGPSGRMIDPGQGEAARKTRSLLVAETRRTAPASAPEADNPLHAPDAPARQAPMLRADQPGPSEPGRRTRSLLSADPRRPDLPNEPETGSQPPAAGANAQHSPATRPDDAGEPGTGPAALGRRPGTASPPDPQGPVRRAQGADLDKTSQAALTLRSSGAADAEPISPPGTASPALRSSASLPDPQDPVRRAQGADLDKTSQAALTLRSSGAADAELTSRPGTAILPRQPFTALPDPHDQARHAEEARRPGTEPGVPSARPLEPDHADLMGTSASGASIRMATAGQTGPIQQVGGMGKAGNGRSSRQDAMPAADPPKQAGRTDGPGKSEHVDAAATAQPHGPALLAEANRSDEAAGDPGPADADRARLADPSPLSRHSGAARLTAGGSPPAVVAAPGPLAAAPPPASLGAPDVPRQDQASQPATAPDRPTTPGRADPAGQNPALPSSICHKSRQPSPSAPEDPAPAPDAALPQASRAERAGRKERRTGPDQAAALPTDADRRSSPGAASQPRQSPAANPDPAAASEPGTRRPAPAPASAMSSGSTPNPAPVPDPAPGPDPVGRADPDPGPLLAAAPAPATGPVPGPAPALPTAIGPDPAATAPPAAADPAAPSRSSVLHSIVQMVAQEQVRRHHHGQPAATDDPAEQRSRDDQLVAALVDRVLARLDQVTRQVKAEDPQTRRAS
ncbi:hypothetical protein [Geminicoccus roseus]|uniref:hypothetical protein n=1 Tax=Geminicoccus roseus TaxID=404900 RepID=UPI00040979E7|nr:hypothetical protein [Geminicoccus roseus]